MWKWKDLIFVHVISILSKPVQSMRRRHCWCQKPCLYHPVFCLIDVCVELGTYPHPGVSRTTSSMSGSVLVPAYKGSNCPGEIANLLWGHLPLHNWSLRKQKRERGVRGRVAFHTFVPAFRKFVTTSEDLSAWNTPQGKILTVCIAVSQPHLKTMSLPL